jgi:hypothetical protein
MAPPVSPDSSCVFATAAQQNPLAVRPMMPLVPGKLPPCRFKESVGRGAFKDRPRNARLAGDLARRRIRRRPALFCRARSDSERPGGKPSAKLWVLVEVTVLRFGETGSKNHPNGLGLAGSPFRTRSGAKSVHTSVNAARTSAYATTDSRLSWDFAGRKAHSNRPGCLSYIASGRRGLAQ